MCSHWGVLEERCHLQMEQERTFICDEAKKGMNCFGV